MPTFSPFVSPDPIIEAALRNDARRGLPPRYATASVTPIQPKTDQSKLDERLNQRRQAAQVLTDALSDEADLIERLARRDLRNGLDTRTIDATRARVIQAQAQLAAIDAIVLDADDDLDLLDIDDMGTAMRAALHRIVAPDLSAKTDAEEHSLGYAQLLGGRR